MREAVKISYSVVTVLLHYCSPAHSLPGMSEAVKMSLKIFGSSLVFVTTNP
jgi:hypothetical protein